MPRAEKLCDKSFRLISISAVIPKDSGREHFHHATGSASDSSSDIGLTALD